MLRTATASIAGKQLGRGERRHAEGGAEREAGAEVPAEHRARDRPELAAHAERQVPDLRALDRRRAAQPARAVRARLRAGRAVAVAPAEVPLGEGAEAFFSWSSSSPLAT